METQRAADCYPQVGVRARPGPGGRSTPAGECLSYRSCLSACPASEHSALSQASSRTAQPGCRWKTSETLHGAACFRPHTRLVFSRWPGSQAGLASTGPRAHTSARAGGRGGVGDDTRHARRYRGGAELPGDLSPAGDAQGPAFLPEIPVQCQAWGGAPTRAGRAGAWRDVEQG